MLKTACATIALIALSNPALAASCTSLNDASALKTAVMQQELMVAALQCHEAASYNRFVMAYRGELQSSDAALKAFFVRRGGEHGEAGYDTFKTKAANLSALEQARDSRSFCADAHALFTAALSNQGSLMSFIDTRAGGTDVGNICTESRPTPVLARAEVKPQKAPALVRVAEASSTDVAVGGVPAHSLPAMPYRREDRIAEAPPPARMAVRTEDAPTPVRMAVRADDRDMARDDARADERADDRDMARGDDRDDAAPSYANADQDDAPPPRPRYYQIRERSYQNQDDGYAPRSYGPPPSWRQQAWREYPQAPPQQPHGWYPRDRYYGGGW
jgi:hypothetical protein